MTRGMDRRAHATRSLARALPSADAILALPRRHFDEVTGRLERSLEVSTHRRRVKLDGLRLSPAVLSRRTTLLRRELARAGDRLPAANRRQVDAAAARLPSPDRLARLLKRKLDHDRALFDRVTRRMRPAALVERLSGMTALYAALEARRDRALATRLAAHRSGLGQAERMLGSLSYKAVLKRGFAVVHDADGKPLTAAAAVPAGERLSLEFADGNVEALTAAEAPLKPKATKKTATPVEGQGRLF
jgi:exodeoxyribonuclease VII large subunit